MERTGLQGESLEPGGTAVYVLSYFSALMAALAFVLAVVMSPALHAASASFTSVEALEMLLPDGWTAPADRGVCAS